MGRRKNGTIKKRGSNSWRIRAYAGTDPRTGKRLYPSQTINGSYQEAQKALRSLLVSIEEGTYLQESREAVSSLLDAFLAIKGAEVTPQTLRSYEKTLSPVREYLGNRKVSEVYSSDIARMYREFGLKYSHGTLGKIHSLLKAAFLYAEQEQLIKQSPLKHLKRPKGRESEREYKILSIEEGNLLVETAQRDLDPLWTLWAVLLETGLRPSEALALEWKHVDLEAGVLQVRQGVSKPGKAKGWRIGSLKTASSKRTIALAPRTVKALQAQRLASGLMGGLVWPHPTHKRGFWTPNQISYHWSKALEAAGLEDRPPYDARHSHATHLWQKKVDPKLAAQRLGHSSTKMYLDTYSHLVKEAEMDGQELGRALYGT